MTYLYIAIAIATLLGIVGYVLHKRNPPKKTLLLDEKPRELTEAEKRRERSKKIWDEANLGDIVLITLPNSNKQRAIAKAPVNGEDYASIVDSYLEKYNSRDESHKGIVIEQWKKVMRKVRDNPELFDSDEKLKNVDGSYLVFLGEVATWSAYEQVRHFEAVKAEVPTRPGETFSTEIMRQFLNIPKVTKATTTSLQIARED